MGLLKLAFSLWLSDFKTKTSVGFLIKKSGPSQPSWSHGKIILCVPAQNVQSSCMFGLFSFNINLLTLHSVQNHIIFFSSPHGNNLVRPLRGPKLIFPHHYPIRISIPSNFRTMYSSFLFCCPPANFRAVTSLIFLFFSKGLFTWVLKNTTTAFSLTTAASQPACFDCQSVPKSPTVWPLSLRHRS